MLSNGRTSSTAPSPTPWAKMRASRRRSIAKWGALLPLLAVAAVVHGNGAAQAGDTIAPVQSEAAPQGRWSVANANALLDAIKDSRKEGLNPGDYALDTLSAAIEAGQTGAALDATANMAALRLAHDYADGRIDDRASFDWHIAPQMDEAAIEAGLTKAIADRKIGPWLNSLLPENDQYKALRKALAETSDPAMQEQLRTNMERWRWMPRKLGDHYLYVNIPTYKLEVMQDGREEATYNVVVGAPKTPTPQLALYAQSVIVNPSWNLPPTVLKEGKVHPGAAATSKGYSFTRRADGTMAIRQAPGPQNALGRIKFDMPNPYAIYLHDTPNKAAFAKTSRALSHGCVRVQNIDQLAASLQQGDAVDDALADSTTKTLQFEKSIPVYLVYFTAQADPDGKIRYLADPYDRDLQVAAKLNTRMQMASR